MREVRYHRGQEGVPTGVTLEGGGQVTSSRKEIEREVNITSYCATFFYGQILRETEREEFVTFFAFVNK